MEYIVSKTLSEKVEHITIRFTPEGDVVADVYTEGGGVASANLKSKKAEAPCFTDVVKAIRAIINTVGFELKG